MPSSILFILACLIWGSTFFAITLQLGDIAPTMQYALEHWHAVERQLLNEFEAIDSGTSRPIIDFQKALAPFI